MKRFLVKYFGRKFLTIVKPEGKIEYYKYQGETYEFDERTAND